MGQAGISPERNRTLWRALLAGVGVGLVVLAILYLALFRDAAREIAPVDSSSIAAKSGDTADAPQSAPRTPPRNASQPAADDRDDPKIPSARYRLDIQPADAVVAVAGEGASIVGAGETRRLEVTQADTEVTLLAHAPGYQRWELRFVPARGTEQHLAIALTPQADPPTEPSANAAPSAGENGAKAAPRDTATTALSPERPSEGGAETQAALAVDNHAEKPRTPPEPSVELEPESTVAFDPATAASLRELLVTCWQAPTAVFRKAARQERTKAGRNGADMAAVNYAYGLLLLQRGSSDQAADAFRAVLNADSGHANSMVAQAAIQFAAGKNGPALRLLQRGVEADPENPILIDAVGVVAEFFPRVATNATDRRIATELGQSLAKQLKSESQIGRLREAMAATAAYLLKIDAMAEEFNRGAEQLRLRAADIAQQLEDQTEQLRTEQDTLSALRQVAQTNAALGAEIGASYDRQIRDALANMDTVRAEQLTLSKQAALSEYRLRDDQLQRQAAPVQERINRIEGEIKSLHEQAQRFLADADQIEKKSATILKTPPLPFSPILERDRLLRGAEEGSYYSRIPDLRLMMLERYGLSPGDFQNENRDQIETP